MEPKFKTGDELVWGKGSKYLITGVNSVGGYYRLKSKAMGEYYDEPFSSVHKHCSLVPPVSVPPDTVLTSAYTRTISDYQGNSIEVDFYNVSLAFPTDNPAIDHARKKLLCPGDRGHKDKIKDIKEAIKSLEKALLIEEVKLGKN